MCLSNTLYEQLSDMELFALTRKDDAGAFAEIYRRYWSSLVNTAYRRLQSRGRAEDLVQDLFVKIYQKRKVVEVTVSLQAYLEVALKYRVLNEFRSEQTRKTHQRALGFTEGYQCDFATELDAKELNKKVNKVLASLPKKCRKVFHLSRAENRSYRDISQYLQISPSTVEKHISKALKTLRDNLPEYGTTQY